MREIKFRAWDKENKEISYGVDLKFDDNEKLTHIRHDDFSCDGEPPDSNWEGTVDAEEFEIMQYTGLKDKNGKEIYSKDWLRVSGILGPDTVYLVDWHDAGFRLFYSGDEIEHNNPVDILTYATNHDCEIIGNLYENPELEATKK